MRIDRSTEGLCGVCRRRCGPVGVKHARVMVWVCDDPECLDIAVRSGTVKQQDFDRLEAEAAIVGGGAEMGAFLDAIGVTDMSKLAPEQWAEMCKRGAAGYRAKLKQLVDSNAAPF